MSVRRKGEAPVSMLLLLIMFIYYTYLSLTPGSLFALGSDALRQASLAFSILIQKTL